ncbi:hypothetical protein FUAX_34680 [Fulvitalea axinellae]|uniref:Organic solvent tolerance-like N-terminal domain-containing protein n=1 Tax=Fulvitalea axinellae TaxID=1182444 RepID=A0AAU9DCY9_9BACT|nr:hypothetical protein FUAX_34680 [Fulvitalea axinellae]
MGQRIRLFAVALVSLIFFGGGVLAQKKEKVDAKANSTKRLKLPGSTKSDVKLVGDVVFTFLKRDATIESDSAYYFKRRGVMECYGDIVIHEGDSVTITGDFLIYDQRQRLAKVRDNVIMDNKKSRLYTDNLDYNILNESASYFKGGRIVDDVNDLTSQRGYYNTVTRMLSVGGDVVFVNPDYTLETDSMIYDMNTKIATTIGYTKVTRSIDNMISESPEGGTYNAGADILEFVNGTIKTESYELEGVKLYYDKANSVYRAKGDVRLFSIKENIIITGDEAVLDKRVGISKVYGGRPVMRKIFPQDTFYLRADTLESIDQGEGGRKELLAYHNTVIYKSDVQGLADSLSYHISDSLIYLFDEPVLWNGGNQITADSINILIGKAGAKRMDARKNSFVVMQDSLGNFNQLKGRDMTAYLNGEGIEHIDVNGNSESLFYALEEKKDELIGLNKLICSDMKITFKDGSPDIIRFYQKPEGKLIPPHEIEEPDTRLKGFSWLDAERPFLKDHLPVKPTIKPGDLEKAKKKNAPVKLE